MFSVSFFHFSFCTQQHYTTWIIACTCICCVMSYCIVCWV